jgi:hypothetical protein
MIKKSLLTLGVLLTIAGTASAATVVTPVVTQTWIRDSSQGPSTWGTEPVLFINFASSVTVCGAVYDSVTPLVITGTAQLENWARYASTSMLSGKKLIIGTYQPSGVSSCRIASLGITQ